MLYLYLKIIHVISSTLLFGTGLGSAFYLYRAHLSKDLHAIAFAARNVVIADWLFTTPAVIIQPLTGFWMAALAHFPISSAWIVASLILYVLIGFCWLPVVWLQIKIRDLANTALKNHQALPDLYYAYMRIWFCLGWPAFIAVMVVFYLMVMKPI